MNCGAFVGRGSPLHPMCLFLFKTHILKLSGSGKHIILGKLLIIVGIKFLVISGSLQKVVGCLSDRLNESFSCPQGTPKGVNDQLVKMFRELTTLIWLF